MNESTIGKADHLSLICVTATGINNLDTAYLKDRGIAWRNVAAYSTESVAQHTFAMLFYLWEHLPYYDDYVKSGRYANDTVFSHFSRYFNELSGKTFGIVGFGNIGRRVAEIAAAFGCDVCFFSPSGARHESPYTQVDFETLLETADIISVHCPLTQATEGLFDAAAFEKMKNRAVFLNSARGPVVVEADLCRALETGEIAAAGLDVLSREPMDPKSPFLTMDHKDRILITPHIAWASIEARQRLMVTVEKQIRDFLQG